MITQSNTPDQTPSALGPSPHRFDGEAAADSSGGGIGAATSKRLGEEGASVVIVDLSAEHAQAAPGQVSALGAQAHVEVAAVAKADSWQAVVRSAKQAFGVAALEVDGGGSAWY